MNYADIRPIDVANGPGIRVSLFVSGCTHRCKECFNPEAWDFNFGRPFGEEEIGQILGHLDKGHIRGLSLLGGEPFEPANQAAVLELARRVKEKFPTKDIWCYSGFLFEDLAAGRVGEHSRQLLEQLEVSSVYCADSLQRRRLLLLGQAGMGPVSPQLPSLDGELLLRAGEALAEKEALRAERLLEAMEDHSAPRWQLLRGECALLQKDFSAAAPYFHRAEGQFPEETAPKLEACYRELQDFRRAYEYACKQK